MSTSQKSKIDFKGFPAVQLRSPDGAEAIVLQYGGHIVSWKPAGGVERLYLSPDAQFAEGVPIRGGVPICFPQFSRYGKLHAGHGFARKLNWELIDVRGGEDYALAHLRLKDSELTREMWPHRFSLDLTACVTGARLDIELEVLNEGDNEFDFTAALHTYLATREVEEASLEGLRGQQCFDSLTEKTFRETGTELKVDREIDRIYYDTKNPLLLREPHRAMAIQAENLPETVVWNPWEERSAQLVDLPDNGFRRMICVESAVIRKPVALRPQESWWGRQTLMAL